MTATRQMSKDAKGALLLMRGVSGCGATLKSMDHILRTCYEANKLWERVVPSNLWPSFLEGNINDWLNRNLSRKRAPGFDIDWAIVFAFCCWYLWKGRCNFAFHLDSGSMVYRCSFIIRQAREAFAAWTNPAGQHPTQELLIHWSPPPLEFLKLNIDGCSKGNPGLAGAGGLFRNWKGEWVVGFVANLGAATVSHAE